MVRRKAEAVGDGNGEAAAEAEDAGELPVAGGPVGFGPGGRFPDAVGIELMAEVEVRGGAHLFRSEGVDEVGAAEGIATFDAGGPVL